MGVFLKKRFKYFIVLLLLALTTGSVWCGDLRCSRCGKPIEGRYYKLKGRVYCVADYEKVRLRCSVCRQPISGQYYTKDNKTYCLTCYTKLLPRCSVCKTRIKGRYFKLDERVLCPVCFEKRRPVCICCHKKIKGQYHIYMDGVTACEKCSRDNSKPRCVECRCPVDSFSNPPIPRYGGFVCDKHRAAAITDPAVAATLMQGARKNIISTLGPVMSIRNPILGVKLVNLQELQKYYGKDSPGIRGFCLTQYRGLRMTHTIYVLAGMSRDNMSRVLAHELAHAWQHENNPKCRYASERFAEGFAEWVSYKTTEVFGEKKLLKQMLDNQLDEYGQGLRDFLQYEKTHGEKATVNAGKTQTSL